MNQVEIRRPRRLDEWIDSLELAAPAYPPAAESSAGWRPRAQGDAPSAAVVAGALFAFGENVSSLHQSDVKNSMLLAQLAANKKYDREQETKQWYTFYHEVLENIGWAITSFSFNEYTSSDASLQMDKVALQVLAAIASGNQAIILQATLDALSKLPGDDKAVTLFDGHGSSGDGGNFQVGPVSEDTSGNVELGLGAFYFKASEHHTRFLFWSWSTRSVNVYQGTQRVVLSEDIYSQVRQQIVEKLGDKAQKFVADIDI